MNCRTGYPTGIKLLSKPNDIDSVVSKEHTGRQTGKQTNVAHRSRAYLHNIHIVYKISIENTNMFSWVFRST